MGLFFINGTKKGFLINFIELIGFVLAFLSALKFYNLLAAFLVLNFTLPRGIANALGFIIIGLVVESCYSTIVSSIYAKIPIKYIYSYLNKVLGPIPALLSGLLVIGFFLAVVVAAPVKPELKSAVLSSKFGAPLVVKIQELEQDLAKIFGQAISDTLSFITIAPQSYESVNLRFTQKEVSIDDKSEEQMLTLVNYERKKAGLAKLTSRIKLKDLAREYGKDMFANGYFSHINLEGLSPFDRLDKAGIKFLAAGENLAFAPNVEIAHQGLMESKGHRENILGADFTKVGIGVMDGGVYGKMFVQEFTD